MNENENTDFYWTHIFGGIDGRCFGCDIRPSSRYASEKCSGYVA